MSSTFTTVLNGRGIEGEGMAVELEAESDEPDRIGIKVKRGYTVARVYVSHRALAEAVRCCGVVFGDSEDKLHGDGYLARKGAGV